MKVIHKRFTNPHLTTLKIIEILKNPEQLTYGRLIAEHILRNTKYVRNPLFDVIYIFNYLKKRTRFLRDIYTVETIKTPKRLYTELMRYNKILGDCDDLTMLMASVLKAIGIPVRLVISAVRIPVYNHIYLEGFINNKWIPIDLTYKLFMEKPYIFKKIYEIK